MKSAWFNFGLCNLDLFIPGKWQSKLRLILFLCLKESQLDLSLITRTKNDDF